MKRDRKTLINVTSVLLLLALVAFAGSCGTRKTATKKPSSTPSSAPGAPRAAQNSTGLPLTIPPDFVMSTFASNLGGPRVMVFDSKGTMLVSTPGNDSVVALPDKDNNGAADGTTVVASGLDHPHGLAFLPGDPSKLYIAETTRVALWDYDPATMKASNPRQVVALPADGEHITRTIMFAPPPNQGKMLIAVGSSVNVGYETDPLRAKILIANADGSGLRPFASGLRNSVFMTVHPVTGQVWANDMGRDYLGDNLPPDELNIIQDGNNYGWPKTYGKNVHDYQFDPNPANPANPSAGMTPSYVDYPAHSAPLGLAFVTSDAWPADYKYNLIVAFHGSWNRSVPTGDKLVRVKLDKQGNYQGTSDFITGWQQPDGSRLGRPTGILMRADGVTFIADDQAGVVYRLAPIK